MAQTWACGGILRDFHHFARIFPEIPEPWPPRVLAVQSQIIPQNPNVKFPKSAPPRHCGSLTIRLLVVIRLHTLYRQIHMCVCMYVCMQVYGCQNQLFFCVAPRSVCVTKGTLQSWSGSSDGSRNGVVSQLNGSCSWSCNAGGLNASFIEAQWS